MVIIMLNLMKKMGSQEPKINLMTRGGYHTNSILFGSCLNPEFTNNKEFSYCKNHNSSVENSGPKMEKIEEDLSPPVQESKPQNPVPAPVCNSSKKKKKKRRRRKKKAKNQPKMSANCMENPKVRERTISVESDDSFIIFFDKEDTSEDFGSSDSVILGKRVRFAADNELCKVHHMIVWSYAYQSARKGPWLQCAGDSDRFKKQIMRTGKEIEPILAADHRARIYDERFCHLDN